MEHITRRAGKTQDDCKQCTITPMTNNNNNTSNDDENPYGFPKRSHKEESTMKLRNMICLEVRVAELSTCTGNCSMYVRTGDGNKKN